MIKLNIGLTLRDESSQLALILIISLKDLNLNA
jgi:hypothetical protein